MDACFADPTLVRYGLGGKTGTYNDRRWSSLVRRACSCVRGCVVDECLAYMARLRRDSQGVMVEVELKKRLYSLQMQEGGEVVEVH